MWIDTLQVALAELFKIYGVSCCVEKINNNIVTMSNDDIWHITSDGHIIRKE